MGKAWVKHGYSMGKTLKMFQDTLGKWGNVWVYIEFPPLGHTRNHG